MSPEKLTICVLGKAGLGHYFHIVEQASIVILSLPSLTMSPSQISSLCTVLGNLSHGISYFGFENETSYHSLILSETHDVPGCVASIRRTLILPNSLESFVSKMPKIGLINRILTNCDRNA